MSSSYSRKLSRAFALTLTAFLFLGGGLTITASAQTEEEQAELDELKAEREQIQVELANQALKVDAATADFDTLAQALDDINALVDLQEARLNDANQLVRSAEAQVVSAQQREAEIATEVAELESSVRALAVETFTGEGGQNRDDFTALLLSDNPSNAARRRSLIDFQTGSLSDGIDRMRALVAEAEVVSAERVAAAEAAESGRLEVLARQSELDDAYAAQTELVLAAELRLEARLAEAEVIRERDSAKAAEIKRQEEAIAARIRREAARRAAIIAAQQREQAPPQVTPDDVVTVYGIQVHKSISGKVTAMIEAARADGVDLGGWGYRSNIRQIELRQAHCGSSEYDIWDKPASLCRPPTARPGKSMHERGLAIDFTYNGGSITTHSNPGFQWLANNAGRWGFVNLPSEPWHWSTNGE